MAPPPITKHRPHLLGILGDARAEAPIAMQLLRQVHDLLHLVRHDDKLAELRTEFRVHLQQRVMSISAGGETAAAALTGLADFTAYVVKYIFEINAQQGVIEARENLAAAGQDLMRIMRRVPRGERKAALENASGELLRAKDAADRCSSAYDAACKDVAENGHAATTALLSLLTHATDEREPSLLGKLAIHSRPELFCKAIVPLLNVKGGSPPVWLPGAILDYAVVGVELGDAGRVVEWVKTCLISSRSHESLCTSAWDEDESCVPRHDQASAATLRAWTHALEDSGRCQTLVYICMQSRDLQPAVMLHRLYCTPSPPADEKPKWWPPPVRVIEEAINTLLTRSITLAQALLDVDDPDHDERSVVPAIVPLLTLWCEVLKKEHAPQKFAHKLLGSSPRLFSQIVEFASKECPGALVVWTHLAELLELATQSRLPKTCVEWLAASIWQRDATLEQEPVYVDLETRPREPVALADFSPWQHLVGLAKPLVPEAWYDDKERGSPDSHGRSFSAELDTYEQQKRLAHAQLEAEEAAAAEAARAQRDAEEREAHALAQAQHEAQMAAFQERMEAMKMARSEEPPPPGWRTPHAWEPQGGFVRIEGDEPPPPATVPFEGRSEARSERSDDGHSDEDDRAVREPLIIHSSELTDAVAFASGIVDELIESALDTSRAINASAVDVEHLRTQLERNLRVHGLVPRDVPGDNNCQFHALSDQVQLYHAARDDLHPQVWDARSLRDAAADWLEEHAERQLDEESSSGEPAHLKDYLLPLGGAGWRGYVAEMREHGVTWGDHNTLMAASALLQAEIYVISSTSDEPVRCAPPASWGLLGPDPIRMYIAHLHEFHYMSTRPIDLHAVSDSEDEGSDE